MDITYAEALEAAPEPHLVILGPAPCQGCGAWVEWAGVEWLGVGSRQRHECEPFRAGQRWRVAPRSGAVEVAGLSPFENRLLAAIRNVVLWPAVLGSLLFACLLAGHARGLW